MESNHTKSSWAYSRYANMLLQFSQFCILLLIATVLIEMMKDISSGNYASAAERIGFGIVLAGLFVIFQRSIRKEENEE